VEIGAITPARLRESLRRIVAHKRRWLTGRRRARFEAGTLQRAREMFAGLAPREPSGADPTART
jgi:hypothetical protein